MTRRNQQPQAFLPGWQSPHCLVGIENETLLGMVRAGGYDQFLPVIEMKARAKFSSQSLLACVLDYIELQVTGYHHAIRRQAELMNTLGVLLRLHQREIDVVNDAPDKR